MENKTITIWNKNLSELSKEQLIDIALIEGVHCVLDFWDPPIITDFTNTMFGNTIVIEFHQTSKEDGRKSRPITLFFNHEDYSYHWNWQNSQSSRSKRISMQTIKYLINHGFYLPLF